MIVAVIVACEVGFWVVLGGGLLVRYGLRWPRTGAVLLAAVPVVDLVLLAATVLDLRAGATATAAHGLAALYLGFSLVHGHRTVTSVDRYVARRVAGQPAERREKRTRLAAVQHSWRGWLRGAAAWGIACALLQIAVLFVGDPTRTAELSSWIGWLSAALFVWLVGDPLLVSARYWLVTGRHRTAS